MSFRARPEYGLVVPVTTAVDGGVVADGGAHRLTLSSTVALEVGPAEATVHFELGSWGPACFALEHSVLGAAHPTMRGGSAIAAAVDQTAAGLEGVVRATSGLRGFLARPRAAVGARASGAELPAHRAIVAAATTSLPEQVGGNATGTTGSPGSVTPA
jgi:hypothetical protein